MWPTSGTGARKLTVEDQLNLVCSSGGSRAILLSSGAILALDQAGIKNLTSIGGISGGSIPTAMYASGSSGKETLRLAIDIDFSSKLVRHASILQILVAYLMQGRLAKTRPRKGVMSAEPLAEYMTARSTVDGKPCWPKNFWTMAVAGQNQILFSEHGVLEVTPDGKRTVLSRKPAPLGLAITASCAVPGIISAVAYKGRFLFDGVLSPEGSCPVSIPINHFGASAGNTIAVDASEDDDKASERVLKLWKVLCGGNCVPVVDTKIITEDDVAVFIKPKLTAFRSLQFSLTRDQKWHAVMAGYMATVEALRKAELVSGEKLERMQRIIRDFKRIESQCLFSQDGVLSQLTEKLLSEHELY